MQRFSANLGFLWNKEPLLDRIGKAAAAGFGAVELHFPYDTPPADVRAACQDHGVKLLGINTNVGGPDGHRGLAAVPGASAEFRDLATQALDYAQAAGGTSVHIMAGLVPADQHDAGHRTLTDNLKWASDEAAARDLTLLLEPINTRDMPGYFYSRADHGAAIVEELGRDNVRLMFDAYHVGVQNDDVVETLKRLYPLVGHVQIAAVPSRAEPDEGSFDFTELFTALDELGYDGWIGCEYQPRAGVEDGLGWVDKLGVSLQTR